MFYTAICCVVTAFIKRCTIDEISEKMNSLFFIYNSFFDNNSGKSVYFLNIAVKN